MKTVQEIAELLSNNRLTMDDISTLCAERDFFQGRAAIAELAVIILLSRQNPGMSASELSEHNQAVLREAERILKENRNG